MKPKCAIAILFGTMLLSFSLAAVTIGPEWCVAYPESGSKDVNRALKIAAKEFCDDINEVSGLRLKALPASKSKPPAIYIGAGGKRVRQDCHSKLPQYRSEMTWWRQNGRGRILNFCL